MTRALTVGGAIALLILGAAVFAAFVIGSLMT